MFLSDTYLGMKIASLQEIRKFYKYLNVENRQSITNNHPPTPKSILYPKISLIHILLIVCPKIFTQHIFSPFRSHSEFLAQFFNIIFRACWWKIVWGTPNGENMSRIPIINLHKKNQFSFLWISPIEKW